MVIARHFALRLLISFTGACCVAQSQAQDWSYYGADQGGTRYSALTQVNRDNVDELEEVWSYQTGEVERRGEDKIKAAKTQNNPIIVDRQLILCTPFNRIISVDPASGRENWFFEPSVNLGQEHNFNCRGVVIWQDESVDEDSVCHKRLLFGTTDSRLFAIDAANGKRCPSFGENGEVNVLPEDSKDYPGGVQFVSPPVVLNDVAVIGSVILDRIRVDSPSGKVRAYNVKTGEPLWNFDPIPRDDTDPAAATWINGGNHTTGSANVWSPMVVDEARDMVFMATSSPAPDLYGGNRHGDNHYADSLVALRGQTGEVIWHYQLVHHNLWDYDVSAPPMLVDLPHESKIVPAVVQATKFGLVFVFHRETGEPLFPIEERPVPKGDIEGEWYSPTQPFPVKPAPLIRHELKPEQAWGFTFWDRKGCRDSISKLRHYGPYTPPSLEGSLILPSTGGGVNWGGPAFDPSRNVMVINTTRLTWKIGLKPKPEEILEKDSGIVAGRDVKNWGGSPMLGTPYLTHTGPVMSPWGAPCLPPPWGGLTAVDLEQGEILWDVPLGSIESMLPVSIPWNLGTPNLGGPIITAGGLIFVAATMDERLRAFDIDNGDVLWNTKLPAGGQTTPMTYEFEGRQYLVIHFGGHPALNTPRGDYVKAFALPE